MNKKHILDILDCLQVSHSYVYEGCHYYYYEKLGVDEMTSRYGVYIVDADKVYAFITSPQTDYLKGLGYDKYILSARTAEDLIGVLGSFIASYDATKNENDSIISHGFEVATEL